MFVVRRYEARLWRMTAALVAPSKRYLSASTCRQIRLIDVNTLELKEFQGLEIPPYSILSHTWGPSEVNLQEWRQPNAVVQQKAGYQKIMRACEIASYRGYEYLWCDTNCIDKASSSELSEAINSMFAWYQQASDAFAYLVDVEPFSAAFVERLAAVEQHLKVEQGQENFEFLLKYFNMEISEERAATELGEDDTDPASTRSSGYLNYADARQAHTFDVQSLENSRWFTRSWTLQELLAPKSLTLYARDWTPIAGKQALSPILSVVTGIDEDCIKGKTPISQYSISHRLSWAAGREATREEDVAYSLLGLCDINMPLLYGEGTKAFRRLQQEIIQTSADESIFAWEPPITVLKQNNTEIMPLLAPSPSVFRSTTLSSKAARPSGMPYFPTNAGLSINLPILRTYKKDLFFAGLNCGPSDNQQTWLPLTLQGPDGHNQYARIRSSRGGIILPRQQHSIQEREALLIHDFNWKFHDPRFPIRPDIDFKETFKGLTDTLQQHDDVKFLIMFPDTGPTHRISNVAATTACFWAEEHSLFSMSKSSMPPGLGKNTKTEYAVLMFEPSNEQSETTLPFALSFRLDFSQDQLNSVSGMAVTEVDLQSIKQVRNQTLLENAMCYMSSRSQFDMLCNASFPNVHSISHQDLQKSIKQGESYGGESRSNFIAPRAMLGSSHKNPHLIPVVVQFSQLGLSFQSFRY
ncbi:hypothetical protein PFICI_12728 [Pestalotiopsis fici W106-1]|uniref:Uncharacterized protein n=1 Tax=Pestalotiopsis fici (strain W106-1 / CGMCC3.15140) TaxID=1229662 RepID=W3WPS0_PESFW|nr:uncharacterized protein PFICI_12728 [Pestalotiopsis fici W106-1]ETS75784.1 hypothetical protein PFICI_12728 [Pestalotiopsis fici W106-1]